MPRSRRPVVYDVVIIYVETTTVSAVRYHEAKPKGTEPFIHMVQSDDNPGIIGDIDGQSSIWWTYTPMQTPISGWRAGQSVFYYSVFYEYENFALRKPTHDRCCIEYKKPTTLVFFFLGLVFGY